MHRHCLVPLLRSMLAILRHCRDTAAQHLKTVPLPPSVRTRKQPGRKQEATVGFPTLQPYSGLRCATGDSVRRWPSRFRRSASRAAASFTSPALAAPPSLQRCARFPQQPCGYIKAICRNENAYGFLSSTTCSGGAACVDRYATCTQDHMHEESEGELPNGAHLSLRGARSGCGRLGLGRGGGGGPSLERSCSRAAEQCAIMQLGWHTVQSK